MNPDRKNLILIILLGVFAWIPTINFWFFKAYEATWLTGIAPYNLISLIRGHAFLYYFDWRVFGWNPWGWYLTSFTLHIFASILFYKFILIISKKRNLALFSSLFFVASTAYNDILTWGSFNSYYPLLLICLLGSLIAFAKYKEKNEKYFFVVSLLLAFIGFFVRETGIVIVPLILAFDFVFLKKRVRREDISGVIKRFLPFLLIAVGFFIIRSFYGGTSGDTADSNVKLQLRFVSDHLYLEYARASFLTMGKLIPPQIIPYDFLNYIRDSLSRIIFYDTVNTYFFPFIGWLSIIFFGTTAFFLRKSKAYFKLFLFFFIWIGLFSFFVSLAVPNTPEVLARSYEYNTMRYRYFAFLGTSVIFAIILINYVKKVKILNAIVVFITVLNLILIWKIERNIYMDFYKPAKEFYVKFNVFFPSLPTKTIFYLYPHAPSLGDYLLEWFTIKDEKYANLVGQPFRVESQMIAVLNKIKNGKMNINDVIFLDYTKEKGLIDETDKVKKVLLNQKEYKLNIRKVNQDVYQANVFNGPVVELPYDAEFEINLVQRDSFTGSNPETERFKALVDYSLDRDEYLKNTQITTAITMSQREGEPFFHVLPKNLIDGNIGYRSSWIADDWAPWVQVDLGREREVSAVAWGSQDDSTRIPATYSISVSKDGKEWQKVIDVKNSSSSNKIDVFNKPIFARYVRMDIKTTSGGDFVLLDEFEVITITSKNVLSYYKDRNELLKDTVNLYKFAQTYDDLIYAKKLSTYYGKLSWKTNEPESSLNNQSMYFSYKFTSENQKVNVEIPELEIFAGNGKFLKKKITSISIDFGDVPFDMEIKNLILNPRIRLDK